MTAAGDAPGQQNGRTLGDTVKDAEDYYKYLQDKHVRDSRVDAGVVGLIVWFASFAVLGFGALATTRGLGPEFFQYLVGAFLAGVVIGVGSGITTYVVRRRRALTKFADLGQLISKMKSGQASSEDGLRLMDSMHAASLVMKKRKMDTAIEYGIIAFALISLIGMNAGFGALAGVAVFLYFRFEALREYEREDKRYEDSKSALLQSL